MFFVNELDGDNGLVSVLWAGFADECIGATANGPGDDAEGEVCRKSFSLYLALSVYTC